LGSILDPGKKSHARPNIDKVRARVHEDLDEDLDENLDRERTCIYRIACILRPRRRPRRRSRQ
jgi:hypothetical protein